LFKRLLRERLAKDWKALEAEALSRMEPVKDRARYVELYKEAKNLAPVAINFVKEALAKHKSGEFGRLVFIGRGARPFYAIAKRLAGVSGVDPREIRLIDVSRELIENHPDYRQIRDYLTQMIGLRPGLKITLVDSLNWSGATMFGLKDLIKEQYGETVQVGHHILNNTREEFGPVNHDPRKVKMANITGRAELGAHAVKEVRAFTVKGARTVPKYERNNASNTLQAWVIERALQEAVQDEITRRRKP